MGRKKRRGKSSPGPVDRDGSFRGSREVRSVEVLTVGWMLIVMMTLVCQIGAAGVRLFLAGQPEPLPRMELLGGILVFAGLVLGLATLGLLPIVYRVRRDPPPRGIVVFAAVVGMVPVLMALVRTLE